MQQTSGVPSGCSVDPQCLAVIHQAALTHNVHERKAAEQSLNQLKYETQHLVLLLRIIVCKICDMGARQVAVHHFKNLITKNWSSHESDAEHRISQSDKDLVWSIILEFVSQVPPLLRVQLDECLKRIIHCDYQVHFLDIRGWVVDNLQDGQVYGALSVLLSVLQNLSRPFNKDGSWEEINHIAEETFPYLLDRFNRLVQIVNPSLEEADLIKLICKIFWYSIYFRVPPLLYDENILDAWMMLFLNVLERPVPLEGQPADPELRKSWGWLKVKKWTIHILIDLQSVCLSFGDLRAFYSEERVESITRFQKHYIGKILQCYLDLLNVICVGGYLPDRVINLILQYLSNSISRNSLYTLLRPQLDVLLFEVLFPLMCFNDNDQKLWDQDPHEFARKGYDIIDDLYSPRDAAINFVSELVRKRGEETLQKHIQFIFEIFRRYDEASVEHKPYRQKDGALCAIGTLCDKLKKTRLLEPILVQHVFPEFGSPVGHLRAKAAWVAGKYANINFSDQNNFRRELQCVVSGMQDPELPVRVASFVALGSFIEACKDLNEIRPILPQLLDEFFKHMNEVENENLVITLETILDMFGEEMVPYVLGLCQNLEAAFWRHMNTAEADDPGALVSVGCLHAISIILESVRRLPDLFVQIEATFYLLMRRMLTTNRQVVLENVLAILSQVVLFSPTISLDMWSFWPLLMEELANWAIHLFPKTLVPLNHCISRGTAHFLKEPNCQQCVWNMISSFIMSGENMENNNIVTAAKLIEVVVRNCRGHMDHWVEPYISITVKCFHRTDETYLKCLFLQVIADALFYNAALTFSILEKLGVASEIFDFWFPLLKQLRLVPVPEIVPFKRNHEKKVCCLGLTSLLTLSADELPEEAFGRVFRATVDVLWFYYWQGYRCLEDELGEFARNYEAYKTDDDDYGFAEKMHIECDDGDQAGAITLRERIGQSLRPEDDDDSDDDKDLMSPVMVDPLSFFMETTKAIVSSNPWRFKNFKKTSYAAYGDAIAIIAFTESKLGISNDGWKSPLVTALRALAEEPVVH